MENQMQIAKLTHIFVIENGRVVMTNLYDHVMASAEQTTSPRGIENKLHILENNGHFQVWNWGTNGNFPQLIDTFDTEEEAENDIYIRTYNYDFMPDDQRETSYYNFRSEAEEVIIERIADRDDVDMDVAASIYLHELNIDALKEVQRMKIAADRQFYQARVDNLASTYAKMISKVEGESYKDTCRRLKDAIGARIESDVFHNAVKKVRRN